MLDEIMNAWARGGSWGYPGVVRLTALEAGFLCPFQLEDVNCLGVAEVHWARRKSSKQGLPPVPCQSLAGRV